MSRIGKKPIAIPQGVKAEVNNFVLNVTGPKGKLNFNINPETEINISDNQISVSKIGKTKKAPAIWGTAARLVENMIKGVTEGFQKKLELNGVGYRMAIQGKKINLALGFSHPVEVTIEEGIEVKIDNSIMTISGIDKQKVGQFAADVKALKPVEPYKGKGFHYVGEFVRKKEGKKAIATV